MFIDEKSGDSFQSPRENNRDTVTLLNNQVKLTKCENGSNFRVNDKVKRKFYSNTPALQRLMRPKLNETIADEQPLVRHEF